MAETAPDHDHPLPVQDEPLLREAPLVPDAAEENGVEQPRAAAPVLPFAFAKRFGVVVTDDPPDGKGRVTVAHYGQPSLATLAEIRRVGQQPFVLRGVDETEFEAILGRVYSVDASDAQRVAEDIGDDLDLVSLADSVPEVEDLLDRQDDAPIIRLINALLSEAIREGASDVHIETFERMLQVRFRVDGIMREVVRPKREIAPLLVSRIKVMAKLDIAEKRIPQDGRIPLRIGGREVDVRVSTLPTANGERVVLRLLDKQNNALALARLGMNPETLKKVHQIVHLPHGIFLVTGPTGSGKTTTLYAAMRELDADTTNILTIENPIEYNITGIGQTQVNEKADMTFARGLRAILRQDPDVVMVGEIRDLETAETAVQASLTGHLVMSTVHTNTAIGAVTRLVDMGVEPFLMASSMVGMLAQRLVRMLCSNCKEPVDANDFERHFLGESGGATVYKADGCEECGGTGFKGRTGIYELVTVDDGLRELIHDQASEQVMTEYARQSSHGISEDGRRKVLEGTTTVYEVMRVAITE